METEKIPITLIHKAMLETFNNFIFTDYSPDQIMVSFNSEIREIFFYDKETAKMIISTSF